MRGASTAGGMLVLRAVLGSYLGASFELRAVLGSYIEAALRPPRRPRLLHRRCPSSSATSSAPTSELPFELRDALGSYIGASFELRDVLGSYIEAALRAP
ncbi:hypothetical protein [Polyangium fumosum]|uniref:Uncharacterized protein n=1 Tax=Polyangium fumosum TaxID=889272 RepID=A0A4U1J810_9BACT|nr:hypothetical protein [Polyangium fumosum]TKD03508.1 hypothetical protein E8A74_25235 [Polyangium fumosum]